VRGYDAAKKVNSRKRHLLVDTNGLVMKAKVHPADLADREGARVLLERVGESFPGPLGTCGWTPDTEERTPKEVDHRAASWGSLLRSSSVSLEMGVGSQRRGARSHPLGLRSDPQALGRGAHIRVDLWQPPDESRLRVFGPEHRSVDLCDDDPTDAQKASEGNLVRTSQTPSKLDFSHVAV
jgi:hypothetical protein